MLGAAAPGPTTLQLEGLLRALCWTPDCRLLLALDRLGNLCALDCSGALQHLVLTAPPVQVQFGCHLASCRRSLTASITFRRDLHMLGQVQTAKHASS